jgi:hypothetical protein
MRRIHWILAGLALAIGAGALAQIAPSGFPSIPTFQLSKYRDAGGSTTYLWAPHCVYKVGTTTRFLNTTKAVDPELSVTLTQNGFYRLSMWIELGGGGAGAGGFAYNFTGTAASSGRAQWGTQNSVAFSSTEQSALTSQGAISPLATVANDWIAVQGVLHITAAPQTIAVNWAQNTSSNDTTSILADSYLCIDRIQ